MKFPIASPEVMLSPPSFSGEECVEFSFCGAVFNRFGEGSFWDEVGDKVWVGLSTIGDPIFGVSEDLNIGVKVIQIKAVGIRMMYSPAHIQVDMEVRCSVLMGFPCNEITAWIILL